MRAALVQLNAGPDPAANLARVLEHLRAAVAGGAEFVLTPEMTNGLMISREEAARLYHHEEDDPTLAALTRAAREAGIWLLIGSLGLLRHDGARLANRSFLIRPDGGIAARYDKIHMFDAAVSSAETYRESRTYAPGRRAVACETPFGIIGLSICYDLRFPVLYRRLARAGAVILTVPSAFTAITGAAHWWPLLRARAIENGAFVLAPAQTGRHLGATGRTRETFGHSAAISPWGEVIADGGTHPGVTFVELDLKAVTAARERIPAPMQDVTFEGPAPLS